MKKNSIKTHQMEDLETLFLARLKPYEDRIRLLEESEKQKDLEIVTLKHAIHNLHKIIEGLDRKMSSKKKNP